MHQFNLFGWKKSAILVNTARGAIVDEKCLIDALKNGKIAGAGADVLAIEPPNPDNPLLSLSNIILTPHSAAFTLEALRRLWVASSDAVMRVLGGELPQPPAKHRKSRSNSSAEMSRVATRFQ